jgi:hypothetical protein
VSILTVCRDVCATVGVPLPSSVFAGIAADRTMSEMVSKANEMAQRIATDFRDWTALKTLCVFTGDGVQTAFPLPANYRRMLLTSDVWRSTFGTGPARFVPDANEWMRRGLDSTTAGSRGDWTLMGGAMHFRPALYAGETASFMYLDKNPIALASGGYGERFQSDNDTFRLDERLLKLGLIWQWLADKGQPYAEQMGTYSDALAMASGADSPAPVIVGRLPISAAVTIAYPWEAPTPP